MCYHLKTNYGGTEAVIDDNCGISKFYLIANTLSDELEVTFLNQVDDADTLDWDFSIKIIISLCTTIFLMVFLFFRKAIRERKKKIML